MKIRMLHVIASLRPEAGGVAQSLKTLVPELERLGVESTVVSCDTISYPFSGDSEVRSFKSVYERWAYAPKLYKWLCENLSRFELVVLHGLWQYPSVAIVHALQKSANKHVKFYVVPHGMLGPWFQRDKTRRLKAWRNWVYWQLLQKHAINVADGVLFASDQELRLARTTFRQYKPKVERVVGMGVEAPPEFSYSMKSAFESICPAIKSSNYLLFLGRIDIVKGVDILIDAYARVAKKHVLLGNSVVPLVIAGPLNQRYAFDMQERAKQLGLLMANNTKSYGKPVVYFSGMLQGDEKWGAFSGCEAFILPSHHESFGIAIVEALACSKPVLISDQVCIAQELRSDSAAIIASDDLHGAIELIDKWLSLDRSSRDEMAVAALRCYQSRYSPEFAARKFLDAILDSLKN